MGNNITSIGEYCFNGCTNGNFNDLENISTGLTTLGEGAFFGCTSLTDLSGLEDCTGLTALPSMCFKNCTNLAVIVYNNTALGEDIVLIGEECFAGCAKITDIWIGRYIPDDPLHVITELATNVFPDSLYAITGATVHVPDGSALVYSNDAAWGEFQNIVEYLP